MRFMENHGEFDIVYLVKPERRNAELRYSLRSVEKNFPHRDVWFYGGCPDGIRPDHHVYVDQGELADMKWMRTTAMLKMACENDEITEWFWLFNDDFFITWLAPPDVWNWYNGLMGNRIHEIEERWGGRSTYSNLLRNAMERLHAEGMRTKNYATHTPLLVNRKEALATIEKFDGCPMFRCLYGNMYDIGNTNRPDVKVRDIDERVDVRSWCISTTDRTFEDGRAGRYIRNMFPDPCRYETGE